MPQEKETDIKNSGKENDLYQYVPEEIKRIVPRVFQSMSYKPVFGE
jgi:hypothetical protein